MQLGCLPDSERVRLIGVYFKLNIMRAILNNLVGITYFQICVNVIGLPIDMKFYHWKGKLIEMKSKYHK